MPKRKKPAPRVLTMETWRGAPCLDFNMLLFFVNAPLDDAATAFTKAFGAASWVKDVFEKPVMVPSPSYLAYQFRGHPWTVFDLMPRQRMPWPNADAARPLSEASGGKALYLAVSDTGGHEEYALFDRGRPVQHMRSSPAEPFFFKTSHPGVIAPLPRDLGKHVVDFMVEQDVLVPPFGPAASWVDVGWDKPYPFGTTVGAWEEFSAENLVRADLISLPA